VGVYRPLNLAKFLKIKKMKEQLLQLIKDWFNEPVVLVALSLIIISNIII